jgi:AraC-like DNA-binding protein
VRPSTEARRRRLYAQAAERIAHGYRAPLTLRALAAELGCSPRELQRAFAQLGGGSFGEQLRARRLAVAAALLAAQPHLRVAQVAGLVGYRRASHLASAFRARHGHGPAEHRERARRARAAGLAREAS